MQLLPRAAALLVLAGCASGGATSGAPGDPPPAPTTQTISVPPGWQVGGEEGVLTLTRPDGSAVDSVAAPLPRTLAALRVAYADFGIPVTLDEVATGRVGNPKLVLRRTLKGTALTEYMRCGSTITGERASNDRIVLSLVSTVRALPGDRSLVRTTMAAEAMDVSGTSADRQPCTSTGTLEERIHARAAAVAPAR